MSHKATKEPFSDCKAVATFAHRKGMEDGYRLAVWPLSWMGESVIIGLMPPLIASKEELKSLAQEIEVVIEAVEKNVA